MGFIDGVIIGIILYSLLGTIAVMVTDEDEDTLYYFAIGVCGIVIVLILRILTNIKKWNQDKGKRSIIYIEKSGETKWCKLKDADNICSWHNGYQLLKRYAVPHEWNRFETFPKEFITWSKRNCNHCKYCNSCFDGVKDWDNKNIKCTKTGCNIPEEFDKFEPCKFNL